MENRRVYVDFEPTSEWVHEEDCDTLLLHVAGFKKDQLKLQLTSTRMLNVSGERSLGNNKWRRFQKLYPISDNCDAENITAKFEDAILIIKQPKLITPAQKQDQEKPIVEAQVPQKRVDEPQLPPQKNVQQKSENNNSAEATSKTDSATAKSVPLPVPEKAREKDNGIARETKSEREKNDREKEKSDVNKGKDSDISKSDVTKSKDSDISRGTSEKREVTRASTGKEVDVGVAKLQLPIRKLMNLVLALMCVIVLGIYVSNSIRSYKKPEK